MRLTIESIHTQIFGKIKLYSEILQDKYRIKPEDTKEFASLNKFLKKWGGGGGGVKNSYFEFSFRMTNRFNLQTNYIYHI